MQSNKFLIILGGIVIVATTSIGLAEHSPAEVSVTDTKWIEIVSPNGTIAIGGIIINVTNDSPVKFVNYRICAQINSTATLSDVACTDTGTLSPFSQAGFAKEGLQINFVDNIKVSALNFLGLVGQNLSQLHVNLVEDQDITVISDVVTITFDNVTQAGNLTINAIQANEVSQTVNIIGETGQVVVNVAGQEMISISPVLEIDTTAQHTGQIFIVMPYDETLIPSGLPESNARLLRFTAGIWDDITFTVSPSGNNVRGFVTGFSQFMAAYPTPPPAPPPPQVGNTGAGSKAGGSSGAGAGGFGGAAAGGSGGAGAGGISSTGMASFDVHLYKVSWNTCDDNIMTIIAGPASDRLGVKLRTAKSGVVAVTLADDQPYNTKLVFEAQIDPTESFVVVQVEAISGRGAQIVQESINLKECSGTVIVEKDPITRVPPSEFHTTTPRIPGGATFEPSYNNIEFEINYKMDTGSIKEMQIDEASLSVTFMMTNASAGEFVLSLPRTLINADNDKFVIFDADSEKQFYFAVVESTDKYVTFRIILPDEASNLTILGTSIVPEFGSLALIILLITLVSVIALTRLKNFWKLQFFLDKH